MDETEKNAARLTSRQDAKEIVTQTQLRVAPTTTVLALERDKVRAMLSEGRGGLSRRKQGLSVWLCARSRALTCRQTNQGMHGMAHPARPGSRSAHGSGWMASLSLLREQRLVRSFPGGRRARGHGPPRVRRPAHAVAPPTTHAATSIPALPRRRRLSARHVHDDSAYYDVNHAGHGAGFLWCCGCCGRAPRAALLAGLRSCRDHRLPR